MSKRVRVAIVGGGVGGLCLAQGLRKAGVEVAVYERDQSRLDRLRGYRIHINPPGARALHECLPASLWDAFLATTGKSGGRFGFITEKLDELVVMDDEPDGPVDPIRQHHSVSRITLHQVLSSGLDEVIHYGKRFERYERAADGTVTLHFEDGTTAKADVLVAADGGRSRVRQQYLPYAERIDVGVLAIAGKLMLDENTAGWLPERLSDGPNLLLPPKGVGMFLAPHDLARMPVAPNGIGGNDYTFGHDAVLFDNTRSYVMWAFAAAPDRYPADVSLSDLDGEHLREVVEGLISDWHPALRRMVAESPAGTVSLLPIRSSVPIDAWESTNVTLIGDAIHSMTPMRGIGANTALRDAELLCRNLVAAIRGDGDVVVAIADYERQMIVYGFKAVRDSMRSAKQFVSENSVGRTMFKAVLRLIGAIPALKRRVFRQFGEA